MSFRPFRSKHCGGNVTGIKKREVITHFMIFPLDKGYRITEIKLVITSHCSHAFDFRLE